MIPALLCSAVVSGVTYAPPQFWALNFAATPRIPLVGDVNNDGYADLICVYPPGESIIDVSLNVQGMKPGRPFQGLTKWGKDCQNAVAGTFDSAPGADVVGIFDGDVLRLAGSFAQGRFTDVPDWVRLPKKLEKPFLSWDGGRVLRAISSRSGEGFEIDVVSKSVTKASFPRGLNWLSKRGDLASKVEGSMGRVEKSKFVPLSAFNAIEGSQPTLCGDDILFGGKSLVAGRTEALPTGGLPPARVVQHLGDLDKDGDLDVFEFRYGPEKHTGFSILVRRSVSAWEKDSDADGIENDEEARLGTDPLSSDTDGDGLLDGWEQNGFRSLDAKALGLNPRRVDIVVFVARFSTVPEDHVKKELGRVVETYRNLDVQNHDGSRGFSLHVLYQDPLQEAEQKNSWQHNRDRRLPADLKGVAHWMQITPGGGGQADQLGDGGTCGSGALWAVFLHEFGHQLGMDHDGFWETGLCPIYRSLMNYAYSYSLEDDGNKIMYSKGQLSGYVLNERKLSEVIPLPYEQVRFLEKGPYRFRLKPNGKTTLIDWNWNGVFGEKNIKADINYSYSTHAGRRDDVDKAHTAPWLFTHGKSAYALYGKRSQPGDGKSDPTVSKERPGQLYVKRLIKRFEWEKASVLDSDIIGDPVAVSFEGKVYAFYQSTLGVRMLQLEPRGHALVPGSQQIVDSNPALVPTVGVTEGRLYLFLWNPADQRVQYRTMKKGQALGPGAELPVKSTIPVGMAVDTKKKQIILGLAQNQDERRPHRWQIRRFAEGPRGLVERSMEWIEGEKGQARGPSRCVVLFDSSKDAGPEGRVYFFGQGMTSPSAPWACTYVAHQVVDKTVNGGWLVKRFYDEWTQSRSAPAAAWFEKDVIWAYRWVDGGQGPTDNNLHVGYEALGIHDADMGDHDDLRFFKDFGIRNSIWFLGQ